MENLLDLPNMAQVASEDEVAAALIQLERYPAASFGETSPLLTVHRITRRCDYWWVFNPTDSKTSLTESFAVTGILYKMDLWNGTIHRCAQWKRDQDLTSVPVTLPAHASTVLMFKKCRCAPLHITSTSAEETIYDNCHFAVRDTLGGVHTFTFSNGHTVTVDLGTFPSSAEINAWHLDVTEISPDESTEHSLDLTEVADWRNIPELEHAVGSAMCTATVDAPPPWLAADSAVMLDVGAVAGAMQLYVNGQLVTHQTTPGGRWSVKNFLNPGSNTISVRLDTKPHRPIGEQLYRRLFYASDPRFAGTIGSTWPCEARSRPC